MIEAQKKSLFGCPELLLSLFQTFREPFACIEQKCPFLFTQNYQPDIEDELSKPQRDVVLSIKPVYSEKILGGSKTVELRRRFPVSAPNGASAYIYSTSPVKAMVGIAAIGDILKLPTEKIWTEFGSTASVERDEFDQYFEGLNHGFALLFEEVKKFSRPLPLSELREKFGFEPPQSFLYAKQDLRKALQDEPAIVSN